MSTYLKKHHAQHGFTLIELMITVGVLAILAAIAVPAYNGYITTSRESEARSDLTSLQMAQLEFFEENNSFFAGANTDALIAASGNRWRPGKYLNNGSNQGAMDFMYAVTACAGGAITNCYSASATGQNDAIAVGTITVNQ